MGPQVCWKRHKCGQIAHASAGCSICKGVYMVDARFTLACSLGLLRALTPPFHCSGNAERPQLHAGTVHHVVKGKGPPRRALCLLLSAFGVQHLS